MSNVKCQMSNVSKGFTLIETLLIIGIIIILISLAVINQKGFQKKSDLDISTQEIISRLRQAQNKALSSDGDSQYGVYFDTTTNPHQYVLFKGEDYANRDPSSDKIYEVAESVEISEINLGTGQEVIFSRLDGEASPFGGLTIRLIDTTSETKNIYIENSGLITLTSSSISVEGWTKDSRHVHFTLGWSVQNSLSLKFYFPNVPQTETVDMATYFNFSKTEFDWNGTFTVAGTKQELRIHTHSLDAFDTLLCVHRDRNQGKNDQEVIIYIVDGGIDKEIAHYLADEQASVNSGVYGGTMEIQ